VWCAGENSALYRRRQRGKNARGGFGRKVEAVMRSWRAKSYDVDRLPLAGQRLAAGNSAEADRDSAGKIQTQHHQP